MPSQIKVPGPDHPITIEAEPERVVVRVGGKVVAETFAALVLQESTYPPVRYIPLADVDRSVLTPSATSTYCPYKGDCSYYGVDTADGVVEDALWFYSAPYPAVARIAGHVAFYGDRAEITVGE
jgi:uncharacterized protein (DUF427 family)